MSTLYREPAMSLRRVVSFAAAFAIVSACSREKIKKPEASSVIQASPSV
jgi:hypothetical protein